MVQINQFIRKVVCIPLYIYQRVGKTLFPARCCRFVPSCSSYAIQAIMQRGIFIGFGLTLWRLLRCNPWSKGGYDVTGLTLEKENI